ncbi:MAG: hypothetical protein GEU87_10745 [Alphaproteobacteria bacterium]|nr:hypothetical protein [Alphaproteobacteria bacterium]
MKLGLIHKAACLALALLAASCSYPSSRTDIPDERPSLAFKGAPEGSVVFVDGLHMGLAPEFNGTDRVLLVEPGNHVIEVRSGNQVLLSRRVFLSGQATRTFVIQ